MGHWNYEDLSGIRIHRDGVELGHHMNEPVPTSNILPEEPRYRTLPAAVYNSRNRKSVDGIKSSIWKNPHYYSAKQIVPPNSSKSELKHATWYRHEY